MMVIDFENLGWLFSTSCAYLVRVVGRHHFFSSDSEGHLATYRKLHCSHLVAVISNCCIINLLLKAQPFNLLLKAQPCPSVVP